MTQECSNHREIPLAFHNPYSVTVVRLVQHYRAENGDDGADPAARWKQRFPASGIDGPDEPNSWAFGGAKGISQQQSDF